MDNKILLWVKIIIPFLLNVLLFLYIYNSQINAENNLANTFFYQGLINLIYGLGTFFLSSGPGNYNTLVPTMSDEQRDVINYGGDGKIDSPPTPITMNYLKLIYVFIGVILIIASIIL